MGNTCPYSVLVTQYCPRGSFCATKCGKHTYQFIQLAIYRFPKEHCLLEGSRASHVCPSRTRKCKWRWMWSIGGVILTVLTGKTCYWPLVILYFVPICTSGPFALRVKYPQVTDVCHVYQCHPTVRWADWTAVLTFAAHCSVCSIVR